MRKIKNSFSKKLILVFLLITILFFILISFLFYRINARTSYDKITEAVTLTNNQVVQQIESRFLQISTAADTIQYYMPNFTKDELPPPADQFALYDTLRTNISSLKDTFNFKRICVFLNEGYLFCREGSMFFDFTRLEEFGIDAELLPRNMSDPLWLYAPNRHYPGIYEPFSSILYIRALLNNRKNSLVYVYTIIIDADEFSQLFRSAYEDTEVSGYLIDPNGRVAASDGKVQQVSSDLFAQFCENTRLEDKSNLYLINNLSNDWLYVTQVSHSYLHANSMIYLRSFLIVLAFVTPAAAFAVVLLTRNLTKRIIWLSESASLVNFNQNQFNACAVEYIQAIPEKDYDEIDNLAATYNHMIQAIHDNIDQIIELRTREEKLNYQLLQSLINPHFLYNILDSIATCNRIGKLDISNKMIMDLAQFYRMTLLKSDELITIRDELEIARYYMELESLCHGENFTWEISMDEDIENYMICKFTLQPFIENSIRHGMQGFNRQLHIQIDIRYGDDTVLIFIHDNGNGIAPQKLEELRNELASKKVNTSRHFGICNVNARISGELFGHGFIEINSTLGEGTSIKIEFQQILP